MIDHNLDGSNNFEGVAKSYLSVVIDHNLDGSNNSLFALIMPIKVVIDHNLDGSNNMKLNTLSVIHLKIHDMKSPFTGNEMSLLIENTHLKFRKEEIPVQYHYYECSETKERFTTTELDNLNLTQVYNTYRTIHNLPFPDEIKKIREYYNLPASKMSEILGFGINTYRNYENGEIPSDSHARLIQLISCDRPQFGW